MVEVERAEPIERPRDEERPTHQVLQRHEPLSRLVLVVAAVLRAVAVVAEHPQAVLGNDDIEIVGGRGRIRRGQLQIGGLVDGDPVDGDLADVVAADDLVTGQTDDAFDEVVIAVGRRQADERQQPFAHVDEHPSVRSVARGKPPAGIGEDDDVTALVLSEPGCDLIHEDAVVDLEGVLHRAGGDVERADQEGLDEERHQERDEDDDHHVTQEGQPASPSRLRAIGRRFLGCP